MGDPPSRVPAGLPEFSKKPESDRLVRGLCYGRRLDQVREIAGSIDGVLFGRDRMLLASDSIGESVLLGDSSLALRG